MVQEKIISYAKEALKRGYPVERILSKLVAAGHDEEETRGLVKKAVLHRINDLSLQRQTLFAEPYLVANKKRQR